MSLNPDLVRARCAEIEESVGRLERFKSLARDEFLSNQDTLDLACYRLLVAIEAALAICYHITAKRLRRVPEEYAECFAMLHKAELIPSELPSHLQQMAKFRKSPRPRVLEDRLRTCLRGDPTEPGRSARVQRVDDPPPLIHPSRQTPRAQCPPAHRLLPIAHGLTQFAFPARLAFLAGSQSTQ